MAEQPEVTSDQVQEELEETRSALADKLAQLGDKITGTVENVEHTVENVTETASETVEAVKHTVSDTVETVKETFNLQKQVQERPWLVVGAAVALGYVGGRLIEGARARSYPRQPSGQSRQDYYGGGQPGYGAYGSVSESARPQTATGQTASQSSWFGNLTSGIQERFGSEINTLKGLALGALFGVVRDMATRSLPQALKGEVSQVIDNMTHHAGGKPIQGSVLEGDQGQQESGPSGTSDWQEEGLQETSTQEEPAGQKKGKKSGGRYAGRR